MNKISYLFSGVAAAAVVGFSGHAFAQGEAPATNAELLQRVEALEAEIQASEVRQAADHDKIANAPAPPTGWWQNTVVSGRMYYNVSNISHDRNNVAQSDEGTGFDIKRFYIGIDHKFDDMFAGNVTTDFQYDSGAGATQLYVKKAYLQMTLSPAAVFRFGSTDLPWVPFTEGLYGYRYIENVVIDRTKFGTSADWGVHLAGTLGGGMFNYALAVIDGAGYKHPFRSQSVDVEGRVSVNLQGFTLAVGGYSGDLGKDVQGPVSATHHTAERFDAAAVYTGMGIRAGVEYFNATNWNNVTSVTSDSSDGYSVFASYMFVPQWQVFGRYDYVKPNRDTNSSLNDNYYNIGVSWTPTRVVDFALVYKHDKAENGSLATSNGTIGGTTSTTNGTYDEIGIWGDWQF